MRAGGGSRLAVVNVGALAVVEARVATEEGACSRARLAQRLRGVPDTHGSAYAVVAKELWR